MQAPSPQFFAGMLDLGSEPDWERAARVVDLMRASGVRMVATPAVERPDGGTSLPFFAKGNDMAAAMGMDVDPKKAIEALSPYRIAAYAKVDPRTASSFTLKELAKLPNDDVAENPTRTSDIRPRVKTALARPLDAFDGLVGLSHQRALLAKIANLVAKHGRGAVECLHMAFTGGPGTGKTELARRLLAYLDAAGVTDGSGTFVKASAADLVGLYVGHTPARTRTVVERAYGGLLFIDEAYALLSGGTFGQEAIDTLVEMLEEDRDRVVCVIAGYPDEIDRLFERNPGLRDRFGMRLAFDGYSDDELAHIFDLFAGRHGFTVDPCAQGELLRCLRGLRDKHDFAGARSVRRLYDRTAMETALRTDEARICACDIRAAFGQPDLGGDARAVRVGFGR